MDTRFHCVYLLTSLDPQCDGAFYIGYTVNPLRRLRQHNGELVNGARRTGRRGRPWTLVCCVSGFTEDRVALKFEWCWQNPSASARLKHTAEGLGGLRRLPYAVATLHLLVRAPLFCQLDLTLHIFEPDLLHEAAARAELFLARQRSLQATGGGGGRSDAAPPSSPEPREATHLPPLTPSLLFHICTTTREAFEDAYLSHDRCLLLPSAGPAWGSTAAPAAEAEASRLDTSVDASCPYDVSLLSQAVQAELSLASFATESPERDGASDWNGVRRPGCDWRSAASRTPSPQRARVEGPVRLLGELSEERVAGGSRSGSGSRSPAVSAPRAVVPSASSASPSPSPQRSLPCTPPPPPPPRIPSRFAAYDSSDFARAHAAEQHRLRLGLLPCSLCALPLQPPCIAHCSRAPFCTLRCHLSCLAMWMLYAEAEAEAEGEGVTVPVGDVSTGVDLPSPASPVPMPAHRRLIPSLPCPCPLCSVPLHWATIVTELKRRVAVERRVGAAQRRRRVEQRWQTRLARMIESKRGASAVATRRRHQRQQRADAAAVVGDGALRRGSTQDADHTPSTTPTAAAVVVGGASTDAPVPPPPVRNTSATSLVQVPASPPRTTAYALANSRGTGVGAAAAATESTLLSLTNFCEEDWWLA